MFPMSYEYALFVRMKLKMRTTSCGDVVFIVTLERNDLFSYYVFLVSLLMDFNQRTFNLIAYVLSWG